jgi:HlyD family secretion protein
MTPASKGPLPSETPDNVVPLPKQIVTRDRSPSSGTSSHWDGLRWLRYLPVVLGLVMLGGIIGLYFQPPGLRKVFELLKLQPGGGTKHPIAIAVGTPLKPALKVSLPHQVIGLGKLIPLGDITTLAPPFGASDARIATITVSEGDTVDAGTILATLDNELAMKAAIEATRATLRSREASLGQIRDSIRASREEAKAALVEPIGPVEFANRVGECGTGTIKRGLCLFTAGAY